MNTLVTSAFKVSAERVQALSVHRSFWGRGRFWCLVSANVLTVSVFALLTVHLGVQSKQQAYTCARLGEQHLELSRKIAYLEAELQGKVTVDRIWQVLEKSDSGLVPRAEAGIFLGSVTSCQDARELPGEQVQASNGLGDYWGRCSKSIMEKVLRVVGELSLLERTGKGELSLSTP